MEYRAGHSLVRGRDLAAGDGGCDPEEENQQGQQGQRAVGNLALVGDNNGRQRNRNREALPEELQGSRGRGGSSGRGKARILLRLPIGGLLLRISAGIAGRGIARILLRLG